jgi:hypothetical protein
MDFIIQTIDELIQKLKNTAQTFDKDLFSLGGYALAGTY